MTRTLIGPSGLIRIWWIVFPSLTLLTLRLTVEGACGDPYDPLPATGSAALILAVVYVLAHVWLAGTYLLTASRAQRLLPSARDMTSLWGPDILKIYLVAGVLPLEHVPVPLLQLIGHGVGCSP